MTQTKWFSFEGIAVYDHEEKRFWHRREIKELALEFWNDAEIEGKPTDEDLAGIFRDEFDAFTEKGTSRMYWDDAGRWEMVNTPVYFGFGVWTEEGERFKELVQEARA